MCQGTEVRESSFTWCLDQAPVRDVEPNKCPSGQNSQKMTGKLRIWRKVFQPGSRGFSGRVLPGLSNFPQWLSRVRLLFSAAFA